MADLTTRLAIVISASSAGAVKELQSLKKEADKSGQGFDTFERKAERAGRTIRGTLVAGATALVGVGLVGFLKDSADAFVEAQDTARQFARATNSTVEEAGRLSTALRGFGLELDDLVEITATFAEQVGEQPALLDALGVSFQRNADGTTNWAATLEDTLVALSQMPDGAEAAQQAIQLLGEEGATQLAGVYLAGVDLEELLERISFVDKSEEALRFKVATQQLDVAFREFQITLGAKLVPVLTTTAELMTGLVGAVGGIPGPLAALNLALIGSAVAWSRWGSGIKGVLGEVRSAAAASLGKTFVDAPMIVSPDRNPYYQEATERVQRYYDQVWALRQGHAARIKESLLREAAAELDSLERHEEYKRRRQIHNQAIRQSYQAVRKEAEELAEQMNLVFNGFRFQGSPVEATMIEAGMISPARRAKNAFRDLGSEFAPLGRKFSDLSGAIGRFGRETSGKIGEPLVRGLRPVGGAFTSAADAVSGAGRRVNGALVDMGGKVRDFTGRFESAGRIAGKTGEAFRATGGLIAGAGRAAGAAASTGVRSLVGAVGGVNLALLGVTAVSVAYGAAAANAAERTKEFAARLRSLEDAGQSTGQALSLSAQDMLETSSYWERFITLLNNAPESLAQNPNLPGRAVQAALEASFKSGERNVESYERALEKAREEAGEYGVVAAAAAIQQADLNELLAKGEYTSQELADAVGRAAKAQEEKNRVDELSQGLVQVQLDSTSRAVEATREVIDAQAEYASAQDSFRDSLDAVAEAQERLNEVNADEKATERERGAALRDVEAAQRDVASSALDVADALVEQRRQADELSGVYRDANYYTNLFVEELMRLRDTEDLTERQRQDIDRLIEQIRTAQGIAGEPIYIPLSFEEVEAIEEKVSDLKARAAAAAAEGNWGLVRVIEDELWEVDPSNLLARINGAIAAGDFGLAETLTAEWNAWAVEQGLQTAVLEVDADTNTAELKIGELGDTQSVTVNVAVDGVEGATAEVEALAVPRESSVSFDTSFDPGGYNAVKSRVDFLASEHNGLVKINTNFEPGGYLAVKSRVDYLAQNRTATLTINQVTRRSTVDVGGGGGSPEGFALRRIPDMYANIQPTNIFKVAIDGQPLRAWIRSEIAAGQPQRMEVA